MYKRRDENIFTRLHRLFLALALLVVVAIVGTLGFIIMEKLPLLEAFYLTLATISTLGMRVGPAASTELHYPGQILVMFLIVVGIASAMIALTSIVSIVVEGHMRSILGRRKVSMKIASLNNHIIVCGYGRMGQSICESLRQRRVELVVIDQDSENTALAEQNGLLYILGDAANETILRDAGIERARGLVAVLDSDASNVFATLVARDLNPKISIAARAEKIESISRLIRAGANNAICPQVIGATRLANVLTRPGVVEFIDFAAEGLELEAEQYLLEDSNKLVGQTLRQANLPRQIGVLVIALKRKDGQTTFNPDPDTILEAGDSMIITGRTGSMAKLEQLYS
ncbi:MAG: TrkA family potassium uptake protein [Sedimentisphaerales bacterium]|nr:TrkA family potassium uptake protein [Sedimentisphaerales bacterium]